VGQFCCSWRVGDRGETLIYPKVVIGGQRGPSWREGHRPPFDGGRSLAGRNGAHSVAMGEDLEDGDGVGDVTKGGFKAEVGAKGAPHALRGLRGVGSGEADSHGNSCRNRHEVSCEVLEFVGWTTVQPGEIGKRWRSWSANSWSEREKDQEQKSAIVLVVPGTDKGWTSTLLCRHSWARWRRRKALGAVEEEEPLVHQATAGVLSEAHNNRL
jgi:hypothetical protein